MFHETLQKNQFKVSEYPQKLKTLKATYVFF